MGRMEKAARTSLSDDSQGKVAMVKQEGDEDPCEPLTAKATRKTIPRKAVALREVNKLQKKTNLVIRKPLFAGLCQSIASEIGCRRIRFDKAATDALQEACEAFLVDYFTALKLTALHAKRVTVMLKDSTFLKELMNIFDLTPKMKSTRN
ncbi:histone-fold-containing protein [Trichoderma pleuroticola]